METNNNLIKEWQNRKADFENIIDQIDYGHDPFKFEIDTFLDRAGKLFFETTDKLCFSFPIPDNYRIPPVGKGVGEDEVWCFREYWLCILGLFSREESQLLKYKMQLKKIKLPEDNNWDCVQYDSDFACPYFIQDNDYLTLICKASIDLCSLIISLFQNRLDKNGSNDELLYVKIKKQSRSLIIGSQEFQIDGEKLWAFLEALVYSKKEGVPLPRKSDGINLKNQADTLRNKIGTEALKHMLVQNKVSYRLRDHVKHDGFSSIAQRPIR